MRNLLFIAGIMAYTQALSQHTLTLLSGEKLEGKVVSYTNEKLIFATSTANKAFDSKEIQSITFNKTVATASLSASNNLNDKPKVTASENYKNTDVDIKKDFITLTDAISTSAKGVSYIMKGRKLEKQPSEIVNSNREFGKVIVEVTIDKYGNVMEALAGGPGTNTDSKYLFTKAEAAARSMKFDTGFDYPIKQTGYVIVDFK